MPTITVTNNHTTKLTLPGGYYVDPVVPGGVVSFDVDDVDEYMAITAVVSMIAKGQISVVYSTGSAEARPFPSYTTAGLPLATSVADGTVVYDTDRERLLVQYGDDWISEPTVTSDTAANLALLSPPDHALAHNTDTTTANYYNGAAWITGNISDPINVQAGVPGVGGAGLMNFNTTTDELTIDTTGGPVWDSIMVCAGGTIAAPPASASTLAGGMYWNTDTNRVSAHDGTNWVNYNVVTRDTDTDIGLIANPIAGNIAWSIDRSRFACYAAAWELETSVGMYNIAGATALNGVVIRDPTGFANLEVGRGFLQIHDTAAFGGAAWVNLDYVIRAYADTVAFPAAADVPEGTLAYDQTGAGGDFLHIRNSAVAWVPVG